MPTGSPREEILQADARGRAKPSPANHLLNMLTGDAVDDASLVFHLWRGSTIDRVRDPWATVSRAVPAGGLGRRRGQVV